MTPPHTRLSLGTIHQKTYYSGGLWWTEFRGAVPVLLPLSKRLYAARTFEDAVDTILDDTIALLGAEYGDVQLPVGDELVIVAQRGLTQRFLRAFWRVSQSDGSACGRALREGRADERCALRIGIAAGCDVIRTDAEIIPRESLAKNNCGPSVRAASVETDAPRE
jgi:hypothetical protein